MDVSVSCEFHHSSNGGSVVTKALDVETETEATGFETESKTESKTETVASKTEAVYLETEAEAQGSCPILFP